jgi:hypothetical protein
MTAWKLNKGTRRNEKAELRVTEKPWAFEGVKLEDLGRLLDRDSTVFRMTKGCTGALIAFSGPGRRVYKVTVSDNHIMALEGMTILLVTCGYLTRKADGSIDMADEPPGVKLELYWVVPYGSEENWKDRAPMRNAKQHTRGTTTRHQKARERERSWTR